MTKNMIIGIGGTGLSAIRELRRLIAERYEKGLDDPAVAGVRFVYIDTDGEDANRRANWTVLGKDISLKKGERVIVTGDQLGPMVQRPNDYDDVKHWLPAISDYVGAPGEGAKGIRPYGRLIYEYSKNKNEIRSRILAARDSLNQALPHEPAWRFYIVCSLSGGTGSGMFLPLAHDLIKWDIFKRDMAAQKMRAFLVLPPLTIAGRHDRYLANPFGALKELNYQGVEGTLPFSGTYLIEPMNERGNEIGLDNLPLLIAQRLFLNIQGGEAAARIDGLMDNPNLSGLEGDDTRRRHALCFSSFGLSSVSYPRETIARSVALEWAAGVTASWLTERDAPQNVNQIVKNDLARLRLSRLHVNGDGDPFGGKDYAPYENEIPNLVDDKIVPLQKRQLGPAGHRIREELETGFRDQGIENFYQQREKDAKRAAEHAVNQVRLSVSRQIRDGARGIRFAKEYLGELLLILEKELKQEASTRYGDSAQKQVALFQSNYGETINTISQHEQKYVYFDSDFARDKSNMDDELKAYLTKKAGYWSGKYAMTLLDAVIPSIVKLKAELDVWHGKVTDTLGKIRGRLQLSLDGRAQDARENGTVIFDMSVLGKLAKSASPEVVNPAIEQRLRDRLSATLERQFDDLDLFALMEQHDVDAMLEQTSFDFILSAESPIDIRRTNLYDRFVTDYPTPKARQEVLAQAQALSDVFTRSVPEEVGRKPIHIVEASVASIPNVIGRMTKDNQEAQTVVRADLEAIGVPNSQIQATQDVERIIFVREKQAFPIRFIESVKRLKERYDAYPFKEALHIDKEEVPKLYDLFLLSEKERKQSEEAEEAFLLARANGWVSIVKNQQTLKPEVRYEYETPGKIGKKAANFGPDWDIASERFVQDATAPKPADAAFREARILLTERCAASRAEAKRDANKWNALFESLRQYLDTSLESYPARTDDPRYVRDREAINRIVESHSA